MNGDVLDGIVEARLNKVRDVFRRKQAEYAPSAEKLHNFKAGALILRTTPEKALLGYLTKHLVSLFDLVDALDRGQVAPSTMWEEKIGDALVYLLLLEAVVYERLGEYR